MCEAIEVLGRIWHVGIESMRSMELRFLPGHCDDTTFDDKMLVYAFILLQP
jgi:hypothetical protein